VKGVTAKLPGSRGYAVNYPADNNWAVGVPKGVNDIINRVNTLSKACPDIKFAMVGYSLGAAVMHSTFSRTNTTNGPIFNKELYPKIVALVMFGDPGLVIRQRPGPNDSKAFPPELYAKLRENCAANDSVCIPPSSNAM
jgi:cutinase